MHKIIFSILLCVSFNAFGKKLTLTGFIADSSSGEPIYGASIYESKNNQGTTTNSMGFFSLSLDSGNYEMAFSAAGYKTQTGNLALYKNTGIKILLTVEIISTEKIIITKNSYKGQSSDIQISKLDLPLKQIQAIPSILGESDPLKIIQNLPGVQSGGEATPGLFVRGSAADQNLVLIDDAPVYNPFHLFGIFSIVNSDALKSFDITKGGFSSEFGGRLASVITMNLKEGNKNKFTGNVSLGLATSKILLEGPLIKNKISIMVSGRSSYAHLFTKQFMPKDQFGSYHFYDLNCKISAELSSKTKLYFGSTYSGDQFNITDESTYYALYYAKVKWNNFNSSLRLNHVINKRLFWNASLLYCKYNLITDVKQINPYIATYYLQYKTNIEDLGFKNDFSYFINPQNTFKFGAIVTQKNFAPDAAVSINTEISQLNRTIQKYSAMESALYAEDEFSVTKKLKFRVGGRLNIYTYKSYTYINPEPRIALSYNLIKDWAFKASYTQTHQYLHLLSSKGVGLPTDLWIPATEKVPFKWADQFTVGLVKDLPKKNISISLEGYYKKTNHEVSFKEGVSFMQTSNINAIDPDEVSWENNITSGTSWAYGGEILLHKKSGRWQGWMGYTLSWSLSQFNELNNGKPFYNRYDRRHNFDITLIYQLTKKISVTASWIYMSGNPITVANSAFNLTNSNPSIAPSVPHYGIVFDYPGINNFRMPAYHRLDIGINYKTQGKRFTKEFEFSVYNAYNRQNPYFYYILSSGTPATGTSNTTKQISVLPILPSVNYKITF